MFHTLREGTFQLLKENNGAKGKKHEELRKERGQLPLICGGFRPVRYAIAGVENSFGQNCFFCFHSLLCRSAAGGTLPPLLQLGQATCSIFTFLPVQPNTSMS